MVQIKFIRDALFEISSLRLNHELRYPEALKVAEEAFTIASKEFNLVHKYVQIAICRIVDSLIETDDYATAEYCRTNYENVMNL